MYVKIRRHQHTRVHAHTGPRSICITILIVCACESHTSVLRQRYVSCGPTGFYPVNVNANTSIRNPTTPPTHPHLVSVTRRSSGVAPRACVRVYARVLVPPNLYMHTYIHPHLFEAKKIQISTEFEPVKPHTSKLGGAVQ